MAEVSFEIRDEQRKLVDKIVGRAMKAGALSHDYDRTDLSMDLIAVHANGCPLDFDRLLQADDFNFSHDIFGIKTHIDRETGRLTRCFLPRCAVTIVVPDRFTNKAHQTAYRNGALAARAGKVRISPYGADNRSQRDFRRAWLDGYDSEVANG